MKAMSIKALPRLKDKLWILWQDLNRTLLGNMNLRERLEVQSNRSWCLGGIITRHLLSFVLLFYGWCTKICSAISEILSYQHKYVLPNIIVFVTASSWGKPQVLAFRDGYLLEALDEMLTPPKTKGKTMQSSEKWGGKFQSQKIVF